MQSDVTYKYNRCRDEHLPDAADFRGQLQVVLYQLPPIQSYSSFASYLLINMIFRTNTMTNIFRLSILSYLERLLFNFPNTFINAKKWFACWKMWKRWHENDDNEKLFKYSTNRGNCCTNLTCQFVTCVVIILFPSIILSITMVYFLMDRFIFVKIHDIIGFFIYL